VTYTHRRARTWSTSRSSVTSQSSTVSWLPQKLYEASPAEVAQGDFQAYGSFTTTVPAVLWLRSRLSISVPSKLLGKQRDIEVVDEYNYEHLGSPRSSSHVPHCPSISRSSTMSSTMSERLTGPPPSHDSPPASPLGYNATTTLHPILEAVEGASKLSYRTVCVTCLKPGKDFPRCPRCGDMWCSRECRMQGGKRHLCRR